MIYFSCCAKTPAPCTGFQESIIFMIIENQVSSLQEFKNIIKQDKWTAASDLYLYLFKSQQN